MIRAFIEMMLLVISPLMMILFVLGVIIFLEQLENHRRFIRNMERDGVVTTAKVSRINEKDDLIFFDFVDEEGEERLGMMESQYYDEETLAPLTVGTEVDILYYPPFGLDIILVDAMDQVKGYLGHLVEPAVLLLISWALIIIRPDFLYLGYVDFNNLVQKAVEKS